MLQTQRPNQKPASDQVELSEHARLLDRLRQLPEIRADRVETVRQAIASGKYETEDRLSAAIDRLIEQIDTE